MQAGRQMYRNSPCENCQQQEDTFSMMALDKINQVVWEPFHKTRLHIHHVISRGHYVSSYKLATVENEPFQSAN